MNLSGMFPDSGKAPPFSQRPTMESLTSLLEASTISPPSDRALSRKELCQRIVSLEPEVDSLCAQRQFDYEQKKKVQETDRDA